MIQLKNGRKIYKTRGVRTEAMHSMSFEIPDGQFVAVMGPSGSGKSTLLNILGGMDVLTEGELIIDGQNMTAVQQAEADAFRKEKICFIFQNFALMDAYTVAENVELPLLARNIKKCERKRIVKEKLEMLGILELAEKRVDEISGGQQQRTAIARALATEADMLLADEPTGALDSENSRALMELLQEINAKSCPKKTIVMVTHDRNMAEYADRILHIQDGTVVRDEYVKAEAQWKDRKEAEECLIGQENLQEKADSELQTGSEEKACRQEEHREPVNARAEKRVFKWVKTGSVFALLFIAAAVCCFHKTQSEYEEDGNHHIERIDSTETTVTSSAGGGNKISPCDILYTHLEGVVEKGEVTLIVYDCLGSEYGRTSDNVPVWTPKEEISPVFSRTYYAGEQIDQWFTFERENGSVYCDYEYVILSPTNIDVNADISCGHYTICYGWQEFVTSFWGKWLGKLLNIETG